MSKKFRWSHGLGTLVLLVAGLACAQAPPIDNASHDSAYYLELASQQLVAADRYRKSAHRFRGGRFQMRREHERLLTLARKCDENASRYEQLATQLQTPSESSTSPTE